MDAETQWDLSAGCLGRKDNETHQQLLVNNFQKLLVLHSCSLPPPIVESVEAGDSCAWKSETRSKRKGSISRKQVKLNFWIQNDVITKISIVESYYRNHQIIINLPQRMSYVNWKLKNFPTTIKPYGPHT